MPLPSCFLRPRTESVARVNRRSLWFGFRKSSNRIQGWQKIGPTRSVDQCRTCCLQIKDLKKIFTPGHKFESPTLYSEVRIPSEMVPKHALENCRFLRLPATRYRADGATWKLKHFVRLSWNHFGRNTHFILYTERCKIIKNRNPNCALELPSAAGGVSHNLLSTISLWRVVCKKSCPPCNIFIKQ